MARAARYSKGLSSYSVFIIPSGQNHRRHVDGMEKDSHEKGQAFQDIQGDVYESPLSEIASAGKNGQFRIPPPPYRFRIQIRI